MADYNKRKKYNRPDVSPVGSLKKKVRLIMKCAKVHKGMLYKKGMDITDIKGEVFDVLKKYCKEVK